MDDRRTFTKPVLLVVLPISVAVFGCSGGQEFPLSVGQSWSYMVHGELRQSTVEEVKVLRQVPVDGVTGFELGGNMGQSRLAWKDGKLIAAQLPNATFKPPIPLLIAGESKARAEWKGMVGAMGKGTEATALLIQEPSKETFSGRTVQTTKTTLTIMSGPTKTELITWFKKAEGPIKQEQRTNNVLVVRFEKIPQ